MSDTMTAAPEKRNVEQHAARLQAAFQLALREEDLAAIARKLMEQAREGDTTSARLVLKYGLSQVLAFSLTDGLPRGTANRTPRNVTLPTPEQLRATIQQKAQEQQALQDEILGRNPGRPGDFQGMRPPPGGGKP
jgi:hypothetical protein